MPSIQHDILDDIEAGTIMTTDMLNRLQKLRIPNNASPALKQNFFELKQNLNTLKAGQPITPDLMKNLLRICPPQKASRGAFAKFFFSFKV